MAEAQEEAADQAESAEPRCGGAIGNAPMLPPPSAGCRRGEKAEQLEDQRQEMAEDLPQLREEQALLVDRLNVVRRRPGDEGGRRRIVSTVRHRCQRHRSRRHRHGDNLDGDQGMVDLRAGGTALDVEHGQVPG